MTTGRPKVRQEVGFAALALAAVIGVAFFATPANAAEAEKEAVRNREFSPGGHFEIGVTYGLTMLNLMTQHMNLNLDIAYNFTDSWALVLSGGYGLPSHTSVANDVFSEVGQKNPTPPPNGPGALAVAQDFQNLWEMGLHAEINLRWAPIYGKLNLLGELPIHFQVFLTLGGGAGQFNFYSPVVCLQEGYIPDPTDPNNQNPFTEDMNPNVLNTPGFQRQNPDYNPNGPAGNGTIAGCVQPLHMTDVKVIGNGGGGFRFFITKNLALKLEVRDYFFPDSYFISVQRYQIGGWTSTAGDPNVPPNGSSFSTWQGYCNTSGNCRAAPSPGFTNIVLINFGLQWIF